MLNEARTDKTSLGERRLLAGRSREDIRTTASPEAINSQRDKQRQRSSWAFLIRLGAALFVLLMAAGCRYTAAPAELLQKPQISKEKQAIVETIEKTLPVYSKLLLPFREESMEAIRLVDVDGDGSNEAIVSYYNESSMPELMVMKNTAASWRPWVLIQQPLAWQINWLKLEDLDDDGKLELLVGWIGGFDSPSELEIYSFSSKPVRNESGKLVLRPAVTLPYVYAETGKLNYEGKLGIAVVSDKRMSQELSVPEFKLTLYNWEDGRLRELSSTSLYSNVNYYESLQIGKISERHYGVVVEASSGAHGTYSAMYAWESGKLRLVYPLADRDESGINGRASTSSDINDDGILEIQRTREAPGFEELSYAEAKWINEWMQWDGHDSFAKIEEEISDYRYGIKLGIPQSWWGRYTLSAAGDDPYEVVAIDYLNAESNYATRLVELYAVPQQDWAEVEREWQQQSRTYRQLLTDSGNVLLASFAEGMEAGASAQDKQAFEAMLEESAQLASLLRIRHDY
jgi:hypothetical protein